MDNGTGQNTDIYEATYKTHRRGAQSGNQNARRFDPETAAVRAAEIRRRNSTAIHRAHKVLATRHSKEFATYVRLARAEVADERGPLPGD